MRQEKSSLLRNKGFQSLLASLLCIVLGLLIGYIVLLIINPAGAGEAIRTIVENFLYYPSAAARLRYLGNTLVKTAPLLMCSLSVLFAYKVGLFNIGAAGQYVIGAGASLYCALGFGLPWYVCLLAAIAAGAVLGAISGLLKAYRNVNEVISCIMLNWISLYLVNALLSQVKETASPYTFTLSSTNPDAILPSLGLGALFSDNQYVTIAIPLTVIVAVGIWVLLEKTKLGYELRATGCNKFAAKYCGMKEKRNIILTMAIAGPFACSLLADLGAEVIGVESPRGRDTSRPTNQALQGWGTQMERRNTRSLCMNVKDGAGRAWFFELLKQADILVDGFRGGQMAKWGMTDEALWEVNPKLTIAHISGFGQTGDPAYVSRASFDGIGQAYGCFMEMNGYPDRLPVLAFPQVSDYYAGFMASIGALAGYINAQRTGKGDSVDVAQYEAMLRCEGFYALNYLNTGALPVREGSHSTSSAGYGTYICQDGVPIYTLILGPGVVRAALPLFGLEYGSELFPEGTPVISFGSEAGNVLEEAMEAFFGSHTAEEAERLMLEAGVPCSRIYTYEMAERDPHYQARESFTEWKNSYDDESIRGVNVVPRMKNNPGQIWRGMPLVGADNEDILEELGATPDDVASLYDEQLLKKENGPFG